MTNDLYDYQKAAISELRAMPKEVPLNFGKSMVGTTQVEYPPSARPLRLRAADLWSKWGFGDGDVVGDYLLNFDIFIECDHEALIALVERYLLPALPYPVRTCIISTIHNPIRAADYWEQAAYCPDWALDVSVTVSYDQVMEVVKEVEDDATVKDQGIATD